MPLSFFAKTLREVWQGRKTAVGRVGAGSHRQHEAVDPRAGVSRGLGRKKMCKGWRIVLE